MRPKSSLILAGLILIGSPIHAAEPIDIGSRLELFVDDYLIAEKKGEIALVMLRPEPKEVVLVTDSDWEGNTSLFCSLFRDRGIYRMIYRGSQHDKKLNEMHEEVTCYAESKDGIHWTKPKLGIYEFDGSKDNNIILREKTASHNFTAFIDENPDASPEARFRALAGKHSYGLRAFQSADCLHWKHSHEKPVITNGAFDSQNLAFWDPHRGEYRAYWRYAMPNQDPKKQWKSIRTGTSKDFITWENHADVSYTEGTPDWHMYTNAIRKYFRAPHLFIGFPTRYLPEEGARVEPLFMSSRDGVRFHRWPDAVIPKDAPKDRGGNRSNYMANGMFQLPGKPKEISIYATENYWSTTPGRVRRFVYRVDGFVALRSGANGGELLTKPISYKGNELLMNYLVRDGGSLRIEVLDESGHVIGKSKRMNGDSIDHVIEWEQAPFPFLNSGIVRLRFHLHKADVFSFQFK